MEMNKSGMPLKDDESVKWPMGRWLGLTVFFAAAALLVMVWRWGGTVEDSLAYFNTARYLRGEISFQQLQPPFPYRLLVPALAAALPGDLRNGFALVNWLFISAASVLLALTARKIGSSTVGIIGAGLLLIVSFPTFWYGPYLLTDPGSIFARSAFIFAITSGQPVLAICSAVFGTAVREENILLLLWLMVMRQAPVRHTLFGLLVAGLWMMLVRWTIMSGLPAYAWVPHGAQVVAALHDYRSLASIIGAAGIVVPLFLIGLRKGANSNTDIVLLMLMALPPLYAALCVRVDGRAVWDLYPFMIPVASRALEWQRLKP